MTASSSASVKSASDIRDMSHLFDSPHSTPLYCSIPAYGGCHHATCACSPRKVARSSTSRLNPWCRSVPTNRSPSSFATSTLVPPPMLGSTTKPSLRFTKDSKKSLMICPVQFPRQRELPQAPRSGYETTEFLSILILLS